MVYGINAINIDDVTTGITVAEMHGHVTNFGLTKGWDVTNLFEIDEQMYLAMRTALSENLNEAPVIANKYAQLVSFTENYSNGTVKSMLVIYVYDFKYYAATLRMPE